MNIEGTSFPEDRYKLERAADEQAREIEAAIRIARDREVIRDYHVAMAVAKGVTQALQEKVGLCATCDLLCPGILACKKGGNRDSDERAHSARRHRPVD